MDDHLAVAHVEEGSVLSGLEEELSDVLVHALSTTTIIRLGQIIKRAFTVTGEEIVWIRIESDCRVVAEEFGIQVFRGNFDKDHVISLRHSLLSGLRAELLGPGARSEPTNRQGEII